jgi:hypothetical protein
MPGYQIIQERYLSPPLKAGDGIARNPETIGFLDFLMKLSNEDFPFDENTSLIVTGLEDLLLYERQYNNMNTAALDIRQQLQRKAGKLDASNCSNIQILIRNELVKGDTLVIRHPTVTLPIYLIFGSPIAADENGRPYYPCSFNLT